MSNACVPGAARESLSVLVVGCGDIAGGYDEADHGDAVLSHAGAYHRHPGFHVAACVEPDPARLNSFMARWEVAKGYADLEACVMDGRAFDVASVCSPTTSHAGALERLLELPMKAVFCEKPVTRDLAKTSQLVERYATAGRPLAVNYTRRWDPAMATLAQEFAEGAWGEVQSVVAHYTKGLLHSGSHMIDLLQFLLGPLKLLCAVGSRVDFDPADPTMDAVLATEAGAPVHLVGGDGRRFARFEATITCDKGAVEIEDFGFRLRRRPVEAHPRYPNHRHLGGGTDTPTGLDQAMAHAVENLHGAVTRGARLMSDGRNAMAAQALCDAIRRDADRQAEPER